MEVTHLYAPHEIEEGMRQKQRYQSSRDKRQMQVLGSGRSLSEQGTVFVLMKDQRIKIVRSEEYDERRDGTKDAQAQEAGNMDRPPAPVPVGLRHG